MATLTASAAQSTVPAKYAINGEISRWVTYTVTANLSAGDVIQMLKVPNGAVILNLDLWTDQFGTSNATITGVGDGNTANRFIGSVSTSSSLAAVLAMSAGAIGYAYTAEDTIDITIGTVTSASNVGVLALRVKYTMDNA